MSRRWRNKDPSVECKQRRKESSVARFFIVCELCQNGMMTRGRVGTKHNSDPHVLRHVGHALSAAPTTIGAHARVHERLLVLRTLPKYLFPLSQTRWRLEQRAVFCMGCRRRQSSEPEPSTICAVLFRM